MDALPLEIILHTRKFLSYREETALSATSSFFYKMEMGGKDHQLIRRLVREEGFNPELVILKLILKRRGGALVAFIKSCADLCGAGDWLNSTSKRLNGIATKKMLPTIIDFLDIFARYGCNMIAPIENFNIQPTDVPRSNYFKYLHCCFHVFGRKNVIERIKSAKGLCEEEKYNLFFDFCVETDILKLCCSLFKGWGVTFSKNGWFKAVTRCIRNDNRNLLYMILGCTDVELTREQKIMILDKSELHKDGLYPLTLFLTNYQGTEIEEFIRDSDRCMYHKDF
jgi:hypothetical protein